MDRDDFDEVAVDPRHLPLEEGMVGRNDMVGEGGRSLLNPVDVLTLFSHLEFDHPLDLGQDVDHRGAGPGQSFCQWPVPVAAKVHSVALEDVDRCWDSAGYVAHPCRAVDVHGPSFCAFGHTKSSPLPRS